MANYYVSPTGNSGVTGLDPNFPTTLDHAKTQSLPGDTILLFGGTYNRTTGFYPKVGTSDNWITYRNYDSTPPVLTWTGSPSGGDDLIHFFHATTAPVTGGQLLPQYVEINGLWFEGNNGANYAVFLQGCSHVRVLNCRIQHCGAGGIASKFGDYYYVANNLIYHCGYNQGFSAAIHFNSHKWTDSYTGFHSYVLNNICVGTHDGSVNHTDGNGIIMDLSDNSYDPTTADTPPVLILNNVCYENGGRGILSFIVTNIWVLNNTCYANGLDTSVSSATSGNFTTNYAQNSYFINNISQAFTGRYNYERLGISPLPGSLSYYEDMYFAGAGNNFSNAALINNDPQFNDLSVFNPADNNETNALPLPWNLGTALELQADSPAAAIGIDPTTLPGLNANIVSDLQTYIYTDINGIARPVGGPFSLGAYQVTVPSPPAPPKAMVFLRPPAFLGGPAFGKPRLFPVVQVPTAAIVTSATPNIAAQGDTLDVVLGGTGFVSNSAVTFGAGITVNSVTADSPLQLTVNISVSGGATVGLYTITVTNPGTHASSLVNGFTVRLPAPTVSSVTANNGNQGQTLSVTVAGSNFVNGATSSFGAGVTVNSTTFNNSAQLTVSISITAGATPGTRDVTVTNPDTQSATLVAGFTVNAAPPTVTSATPDHGYQGQTLDVTIAGTFFVNGATSSFGSGITVNSTTFNSSIQLTANITIAGGATVGVRTITVTNPDTQTGSLVAGFSVTLVPPTVSSITANNGNQGQTLSVVIAGTNFVSTPTVSIGSGITINTVTFDSAIQLTVNITIAAGAIVGTRDVTVTNPDTQSATLVAGFTVNAVAPAPTVTSATANTGIQGQTLPSVVIAGANFVATPTVSFGAGITVNSVTFNNSAQLTVSITIAPTATVGNRNVVVTNPDLQVGTGTNAFSVTAAAPTVSSATPNSGIQGQTISSVIIAGTFFVATPTVSFGAGITVNSVTWNSSIQLTVSITIAGGATPGARTITVTNPDTQSGTLVSGFTVFLPAPTVSSVTANTGAQGQTLPSVTIVGTGFVATPTVSFGSGITVNSVTFTNSTHLDVSITIAGGATVGLRDVTVTNPDTQAGTLVNGFTVTLPAPTVSSVTANSGQQGATLPSVTIVGTGFVATPTVSFGAGITVNSVSFTNSTHLSVSITIALGASVGVRTVTVTNPDTQSGSLVSGFTVTAAPTAPTVTSVTPNSGMQGDSPTGVVIVGTNFVATPTVSFGAGITVSNIVFTDSAHLSVDLAIADGATPGTRNVVVTNPDTQAGTGTNAFTVTAAAPVLTSVTPTQGERGQCIPNVIIAGNFFQDGATADFGAGITVNFVLFDSLIQLTVNITIAVDATLGARTVTVTNPDNQSGSL